jgi:Z1 domain/Type III restriction enzyme, res subunit
MPTKLKLFGFINPTGRYPSFLVPVFGDSEGLWLQDVDPNGRISCFRRLEEDSSRIAPVEHGGELGVGHHPIFAFAFNERDFVFGDKTKLSRHLVRAADRYQDVPFARTEVLEFIGNFEELQQANEKARQVLASLDPKIADLWLKSEMSTRLPRTVPDRMAPNVVVDGNFYTAYKTANPHFSPETLRCAEETIGEILTVATTSENPGMLLGKVQSGKTRTFINIIALAFDNGFDIAVVLSKNSKALLEQTAKRLNTEFKMFIDEGELEIYDIMHAPESFGAFELDSKLIFVAKKQSDNLRRLTDLFENNPAMAAKRTLIIDDEADAASIGYTKRAGLIEARKIAMQVSELRSIIQNSSFLQVTATPYSLYLQPTEVEVANVITFKPTRPAFTRLVPVPADYVGGETYFGHSARSETDTLESLIHHTVDPAELERLKKHDGRSFKLDDVLTTPQIDGYRTAIVNFIVGGCIQRINGARAGGKLKKLRYSFLLHSEAGKAAHEWQELLTHTIRDKLKAAAQANDPVFIDLVTKSYNDLSKSLLLAGQPIPPLGEVLAAVTEALKGEYITVSKVNSDDDVAALLDATGQLKLRSPLNIFLGGQVLDRGVTLANLIGFYYGRRPNKFQQDTVLQHSRMYGYRRPDLAVTRFYTSPAIRFAMAQMEEFDQSLRAAIEAGGDRAVQFIRKAADGRIVPCSPNKILVATTQTLRPGKRILPIGFQTHYRTGAHGIGKRIEKLDEELNRVSGFNADEPKLVPLTTAIDLLNQIEPTMEFPEDDAPPFDWDGARAALTHLSQQHPNPSERGKVWIWAAKDRNSARFASASSHATYIETPDSEKTEGQIAKKFATDYPILFLLRQNGSDAPDKGWRGTSFYWPVIRAQAKTPTAIYTAETI